MPAPCGVHRYIDLDGARSTAAAIPPCPTSQVPGQWIEGIVCLLSLGWQTITCIYSSWLWSTLVLNCSKLLSSRLRSSTVAKINHIYNTIPHGTQSALIFHWAPAPQTICAPLQVTPGRPFLCWPAVTTNRDLTMARWSFDKRPGLRKV